MEGLWFGEGSIKQVENGRRAGQWRLRWAFLDADAEKRVEVDKYFPLQGDARRWLAERKRELLAGKAAAGAKAARGLTLQGFYEGLRGTKAEGFADGRWVQDGAEPQTVATKAHRWGKWVEGRPIAERPIRALVRDDARAHVRWMKERGASIPTMTDVLGVLKKVLNDAIRERPECRNMANPFVGLALQSASERAESAHARQIAEADSPSVIVLSPSQAAAALRDARGEDLALVALYLLSGLRVSEGMALCREQVDLDRGVIVVDRAVKIGAGEEQWTGLPKGSKTRVAAMCPTLARILAERMRALPAETTHLFPQSRSDAPRTKKQTYAAWRRAVAAAGLPGALTPQMCRVSHNNWVEKLMPKVSLSTRLEHMGHSLSRGGGGPMGVAVNLRNYTASIPEGLDVLRREIERVVASAKIVG